jgi:hypothetical protein
MYHDCTGLLHIRVNLVTAESVAFGLVLACGYLCEIFVGKPTYAAF